MKRLRGSLAGAFLLLGLSLAFLYVVFPAATGNTASVMISSSMAPEFPRGSLAVSTPMPYTEFKVGDVVRFQNNPDSIPKAHRVIEINADGTLVTKGDALPSEDAFTVGPKTFAVSKVIYTSFWLGWMITLAPWVMGILVLLYMFTFSRASVVTSTSIALIGALAAWLLCMFMVSPVSNIELIDVNKSKSDPYLTLVNTGLAEIVVTPISDGVEGEGVNVSSKEIATVSAEPESDLVDFSLRPSLSPALLAFSLVPYLLWLPFYIAMAGLESRREEEDGVADSEPSSADQGVWDDAGFFTPASPRVPGQEPAQSLL